MLNKIKMIQLPDKQANVTTDFISRCSELGIPIFLSDNSGIPKAQIIPNQFSHVKRMMAQVKFSEGEHGLTLAKELVSAKIKNQLKVIQYFSKYHLKKSVQFAESFSVYKKHVESTVKKIKSHQDSNNYKFTFMGYEGSCASLYWGLFGMLIKNQFDNFTRKHRGAGDPVNNLLNYGYGILYHRLMKRICQSGLNPCCSFLHQFENNRPSLVFDLIEPFRALAIDRTVISILNKGITITLQSNLLDEQSRKTAATQFLKRLHSQFNVKQKETSLQEELDKIVATYVNAIMNEKAFKPFIWFY